jgi:hypothetical protein
MSIIGIMAATLITPMTKMAEYGPGNEVQANLKNLAQAEQSVCGEKRWEFSLALSQETSTLDQSGLGYGEAKGGSRGQDLAVAFDLFAEKRNDVACFYGNNAYYSITNGVSVER